MSDAIAPGKVGIFHYTLTDEEGAQLDSSRGRLPMAYLHGHNNIVPGLEAELAGKTTGATFTAEIAPKDGYGEKQGPGPQAVHRSNFPKDFEPTPGRPIRAEGGDGEPITLWIVDVKGAQIYVDINHPLAGKTLTFDVEIVGVRDATADEQAHGHAHGPEGHASH